MGEQKPLDTWLAEVSQCLVEEDRPKLAAVYGAAARRDYDGFIRAASAISVAELAGCAQALALESLIQAHGGNTNNAQTLAVIALSLNAKHKLRQRDDALPF